MCVCELSFYKLCGYFAATKRSADDVRLGNMLGLCSVVETRLSKWEEGRLIHVFRLDGGPLERTTTAGLHLSRFAGVYLCVCVFG